MKRVPTLPRYFKPYLYLSATTLGMGTALVLWTYTGSRWEGAERLALAMWTLLAVAAGSMMTLILALNSRVNALTRYSDQLTDGGRAAHGGETDGLFAELAESISGTASRLQERIRAAESGRKQLAAILGSMSEGVVVVDTEERIVIMNPTLTDALGTQRSELEGKLYWEVIRDTEINEMLRRALTGQHAARLEHTPLLTDRIFQITVSPVSGPFGFLGIIAVFYDVTRIKEFERLRSEFVANVSHELKTPLTSILGFVETLREGAVEDKVNRDRFLQIIEDHARTLHEMIEDLLQLSRLESSAEPVRKELMVVEPLLDRLVETLGSSLKLNKIAVERQIEPGARVLADPKTFERALLNLIDNAVKYNREGGRVTVSLHETPSESILEVGDTGIGIAESDLARVFERFYRVDRSRSRESGGTGLGLSIVKHILERHGGRIQARSTPGKGSTFTVFLPKA